jgi:hypothetical protein
VAASLREARQSGGKIPPKRQGRSKR